MMAGKSELALDLTRPWLAERRADGLARGVCRLLDALGYSPLIEVPLASGRRADVLAMDGQGRFVIVEIKSGLADFRNDGKWPGYLPYCDRLYFAVNGEFPVAELPEHAGVVVADRYGAEIIREAPIARRRQAIRFARIAANRLRFLYEEVG
jgi:hypothetical protein